MRPDQASKLMSEQLEQAGYTVDHAVCTPIKQTKNRFEHVPDRFVYQAEVWSNGHMYQAAATLTATVYGTVETGDLSFRSTYSAGAADDPFKGIADQRYSEGSYRDGV